MYYWGSITKVKKKKAKERETKVEEEKRKRLKKFVTLQFLFNHQ